ncbi:PHB depolymerase family esterase [Cryobacterium suzukii]|uniref:PHB depolymerase family esterase n=1 Tax=Cryobacterium suzukii TaxID=1259198 RepID=A0A4R9ADP5_9MICO|nr:PHB depolymerase family esterase [Cryobacterium suzukii]TFD57297.1 PHB depolymerase family esterase [Cryobacterium suzukii]
MKIPTAIRARKGRLGLIAGLVGVLVATTLPISAASAAGAWTTETISGMQVQLYTPTTTPAIGGERALMINLHGCVQTSSNLKAGGNWTATADKYGMVIAIPAAPGGGVIAGCWDYYDGNHSRSTPARHDDNLLGLVSALLARPGLTLDADQVYLSGLSSGGGETMVMGCLAPDVFAGIGMNAGPSVGTTSNQIGYVATTKSAGIAQCNSFAGSNTAAFDTQLTSVVYGSNDTTVAPGYNTLNAQIMAGIYNAPTTATFSLSTLAGSNTAGSGTTYSDATGPRVSIIQNTGLGHNWPAGAAPGGSYISTNSINYPAYLASFFFQNNRRVTGTPAPDPTPTPTPSATPTPTPTPSPTPGLYCGTLTNAAHEAAGHAISYGNNPYNPYYALGTQNYLGQGDTTVTTLREAPQGTFTNVTSC